MACGYAGMLFVGGNIPPGAVLATTVWGNSASWSLAALPLFIWMGEILFRTKLSEEMFRGLAPWLNWHSRPADARQRAGLRHLRLGVGLVGRDLRHRRQDRAAGTEEARLRREGVARLARRRRHARHPHSAVDHDGDLRGAGQRLDHPGVPRGLPAGLPGDGAVLRLHRDLVAAQSGQAAAARAADDVPREGAGVGAAHSDLLLILLVFARAAARLGDRDRMRRLGRDGLARHRLVSRHAELGIVLAERDGRDARHLHDHADPGRRVLHVDLDGLHRRAAGAGRLGRPASASAPMR